MIKDQKTTYLYLPKNDEVCKRNVAVAAAGSGKCDRMLGNEGI